MKKINITAFLMILLLVVANIMEVEAQVRRPNTGGTSTRGPAKPTGKSIFNSEKFFIGGEFGNIFFNAQSISIVIAPLIGYRITEKAAIAAGPSFQYPSTLPAISTQGFDCERKKALWGARAFTRYDILNGIAAHAEFNAYNFQKCTVLPKQFGKAKKWIMRLPIGGSYSRKLAGRTYANVSILYDVLYDEETSPFNSPLIYNGGINIRL